MKVTGETGADTVRPAWLSGGERIAFSDWHIRLFAALPLFGLAIAFAWPMVFGDTGLLGVNHRILGRVMQIEMIVVLSGGFLIMPALVAANCRSRIAKSVYAGIFLLFAFGFAVVTYREYEVLGVLGYVGLTLATFGGVILGRGTRDEVAVMCVVAGLRWLAAFVLFALTLVLLEPGTVAWWHTDTRILLSGVVYFTALGAVEMSGLYDLPRRLIR